MCLTNLLDRLLSCEKTGLVSSVFMHPDAVGRRVLEGLRVDKLILLIRQVRTRLDIASTLGSGVNTQLGTLIKVKVVEGQTTEDIVNDRRGNPNVRVVGHASWLKLEVGELLGEGFQRHTILQTDRHRDRKSVHNTGKGGSLLTKLEEDLAQAPGVVSASSEVTAGSCDLEAGGAAHARLR